MPAWSRARNRRIGKYNSPDTKGNFRKEGLPGSYSFFGSFTHLTNQNMQMLASFHLSVHPSIPSIYSASQPASHTAIHSSINSIHLSIHLYITPIYPSTYPLTLPSVYPICSDIHLSIGLSVHLSHTHPRVYSSTDPFNHQPVCHLPNHRIHVAAHSFILCPSSHSSVQPSASCQLLSPLLLYAPFNRHSWASPTMAGRKWAC